MITRINLNKKNVEKLFLFCIQTESFFKATNNFFFKKKQRKKKYIILQQRLEPEMIRCSWHYCCATVTSSNSNEICDIQ